MPPPQIRWHIPNRQETSKRLFSSRSLAEKAILLTPPDTRTHDLESAIALVGIPIVEGTASPHEWALTLLQCAAEVEHALMVQYLYAALSFPIDGSPDLRRYRDLLISIAIEEMGHLATVQNLLLLVGGVEAIHLQRDKVRRESGMNPIPFVLEPIARVALAKYLAAERPIDVPETWKNKVTELVVLAEREAGVPLKRVGVMYELLRWIFSPSDLVAEGHFNFSAIEEIPNNLHLTNADLRPLPEIAQHLATRDEWSIYRPTILLFSPHTCAEAIAAIDAVAAQGEGLLNDPATSHFEAFMSLIEALDGGHLSGILPLPTSPTLGQHGGEHGITITHTYTKIWGAVFSLQYTLLILSIQHAFLIPRPTDGSQGLRAKLAKSAVQKMRLVLKTVGELIITLPLETGRASLAGPPYDLDPAILESHNLNDLPNQHLALLDALETQYRAIQTHPDYATHQQHAESIEELRAIDSQHRQLMTI